jgi:hypothetical protein
MTDIETLRQALQAPAGPEFGRLPIGEIVARGRRLRRRRQALAAGGCACLAAVLAAAGIAAGHLGRSGQPGVQSPLTAAPILHQPRNAYGAVIRTGIRNSSGELVFYAVRVHVRQLPKTTFGITGGYLNAAGHVRADVTANEFSGSDVAPGFHAVEAPNTVNGQAIPEFGYYAGPAVKITGKVGGRTIRAGQAQWSMNPRIVIFWFVPRDDRGARDVTGLAAFKVHGKRLPPGHTSVGHG